MSVLANSIATDELTNFELVMVVPSEFSMRIVPLINVNPDIVAYCEVV